MDAIIETVSSRNMWAIMTKFNKLPTDKTVQDLTQEQIDWVIGNMNYDIKEAKAISQGWEKEDGKSFRDSNFDDFFNNSQKMSLVPEGFDMDDVYKQVIELTTDPNFQEQHAKKLEEARTTLIDKKLNYEKVVDEQIAKTRKEFQERSQKMEAEGKANTQIADGYFMGDEDSLDDLI